MVLVLKCIDTTECRLHVHEGRASTRLDYYSRANVVMHSPITAVAYAFEHNTDTALQQKAGAPRFEKTKGVCAAYTTQRGSDGKIIITNYYFFFFFTVLEQRRNRTSLGQL